MISSLFRFIPNYSPKRSLVAWFLPSAGTIIQMERWPSGLSSRAWDLGAVRWEGPSGSRTRVIPIGGLALSVQTLNLGAQCRGD